MPGYTLVWMTTHTKPVFFRSLCCCFIFALLLHSVQPTRFVYFVCVNTHGNDAIVPSFIITVTRGPTL